MTRKWSADLVIATIRERSEMGLSLRSCCVRKDFESLIDGARKFFGSWKLAVETAGFDYKEVRQGKVWSKDLVVQEIKRRNANKLALNSRAVQVEDQNLANAARRHFGSWKLAVKAAGIVYESVTKHKRWSKEKIIRAIQVRSAKGYSLSCGDVRRDEPKLESAGVQYFGNWETAIEAAGYDYDKVIKQWRFKRRIPHCVITVELKSTTATKSN